MLLEICVQLQAVLTGIYFVVCFESRAMERLTNFHPGLEKYHGLKYVYSSSVLEIRFSKSLFYLFSFVYRSDCCHITICISLGLSEVSVI